MPSEYIRDNIVLSMQHEERTAIELHHRIGINNLVFAFNVLGNSLRDVLDPRLRGRG